MAKDFQDSVSTPCDTNPCQNGGVCTNTGITFFCTCSNGFTGQTCQISPGPTDGFVIDPCVSNPCQNGAPCTPISSITFRCNCRTGFVGHTCNVRDTQAGTCNPNPCFNGGVCSVSGTGYSCDCSGTSGFTGTNCEYRPEELCAPGSEGDLACGTRTCLNRNVLNEPSYVCVCSDAFQQGHDCSVATDNRYITTCYGSACKRSIDELGRPSNYFESLNYPQVYIDRLRALYLLYLPGVAEICFTFDQSAFGIENDKDELYVGPGLEFDFGDLAAANSPDGIYFFEDRTVPAGRTAPNDFCIPSDTVWMYFLTDKNIQGPGWRLYWSVEGDSTPPTVICPEGIVEDVVFGQGGRIVTWTEPRVSDNSGIVPELVYSSHTSGSFFNSGQTTVTYVYRDGSENEASCTINVFIREVDRTPPVIIGGPNPNGITETTACNTGGTTVSWPEPTATDNSGIATLASRSHTPGQFFPIGTTTVTYRFVDPTNNAATFSFDVTVNEVDTMPPICAPPPTDETINIPLNQGSTAVFFTEPRATDNCGETTLQSRSHQPGDTFNEGTTRVSYTFRDLFGNIVTCSLTVNVEEVDLEPPVADGPSIITETTPLNSGGKPVIYTEPTATDNSGVVTLVSRSHTPGQRFLTGTTTVTYVFEDPSGNRVTYTFNVVVNEVDTIPPVISGPNTIAVTTPLDTGGRSVSYDEPTATDNSGSAILVSRSHSPNQFFPTGTTTVTYIFRDPSGNEATYTFDVIVAEVDNTPPTCSSQPNDITRTIPLNQGSTSVSFAAPRAQDDCGQTTFVSSSHQSGDPFNMGTTRVSYVYSDSSGNQVTCSFNVIVNEVDSTPPRVSGSGDTTVTTPLNSGGRTVTWTEPTATDNSGSVTLVSRSHAPGTRFNTGTTRVTYVFRDPTGNEVTYEFDVNVVEVDMTPPTVSGSGDTTVTTPLDTGGRTVTWTEPTATDNSGSVTLVSRSHVPGTRFNTGTTTVTYVFRDPSGNEVTYEFDVNVVEVDITPPTVSGSGDRTVTTPLNTGGRTVTWTEPTATDNSGRVSLVSRSHVPGSRFNTGTTTVTYVFEDPSGNRVTYEFDVNVVEVDDTPPVINAPSIGTGISVSAMCNTGGTEVTWTEPTATDNSGTATLVSRSHTPGQFFPRGTTTVTYRFADPTGNSATFSFDVDVQEVDNTPPTCSPQPNDITRIIPLNQGSTSVSFAAPRAQDDCGQPTFVSSSHQSGSTFNTGTTQVNYVYRDSSGNQVTCSFNVIVNEVDSTPPRVSGSGDTTVTTPLDTGGRTVTWTEPTATDNSGSVTLVSRSHAPGTRFDTGTTRVTYIYRDPSGNEVTYEFDVNVVEVDGTPPTVSGSGDTTVTTPLNSGGRTVTWTEPTATDNSGSVTLVSRSHAPGTSFPTGTTTVTYVFRDPSGNEVTYEFDVNVVEVDTTPPIVSGPLDTTIITTLNSGGRTYTWTEPTATDNSGSTVTLVSRSHTPGARFPTGTTTVTYVYRDPSGNEATYDFDVTVIEVDSEPPVVTGQGTVQVNTPLNSGGTDVFFSEPTATDNSGMTTLVERSHTPGQFFPTGTTTVTYIFRDPSGNRVTYDFDVIVDEVDSEPPTVQGPGDTTVQIPLNGRGTNVRFTEPTATDNSGTVRLVSRSHTPGQRFPTGTTTVTYVFEDPSGNQVVYTFDVIVEEVDTEPPVIRGSGDTTVTTPLNSGGSTVTWNEPTATDNSGIVTLVERSHAPGTSFPTGTTRVRYVYQDPSGNRSTYEFDVNVVEVDDIPPVINHPSGSGSIGPDISVTTGCNTGGRTVTWTEPTATDNSGSVSLAARTRAPGQFFTTGTTPVTYRFVDPSSNEASYMFNVIVTEVDPDPPTCGSLNDIELTIPLGIGGTTATWTEPIATDNCSPTSLNSRTHAPGDFFNTGTTRVSYLFSDESGNFVTCAFNVQVTEVDTSPPVVSGPDDMTVTIPLNTGGTNVNFNVPTATDNSGSVTRVSGSHNPGDYFPTGTTTVTYVFRDPSGNTNTYTFDVVVLEVDTTPPQIIGSGDVTVTTPLGTGGRTVTWPDLTANDNSGVATLVSSTHTNGQFFTTGTTTVTYTFTDPTGNTATYDFNVNVIEVDEIPPTVSCPANVQHTSITGLGGMNIDWNEASSTDNSGVSTLISRSHVPGSFFPVGETPVTYTFEDPSGNSGSCTFTVTISEANPCLPQPCLNAGTCVIESPTAYTCLCPECYSGNNCQTGAEPCANHNCANGAACVPFANSCDQYYCECPDCFTGTFCTQRADPCANHQCQNGAQCTPNPADCSKYTCTCPACFSGQFCQNVYDACTNHQCTNGGQCISVPNGGCTEYTCSCSGCFTGLFCQESRDPCALNPCVNGGICSQVQGSCFSYQCQCSGCFSGFNCELAIPNPCSNNPCQNNGFCNVIPGQCFAYSCRCPLGFTGINCDQVVTMNMNPCTSFPCMNGGSCLTMDATYYICVCPADYLGINCQTRRAIQINLDSCTGNPCSNGDCYNSYNSISSPNNNFVRQYTCVCENGFTGVNCALRTTSIPELDICNLGTRPPCRNGGVCFNDYHSFDQDVDYFCQCPVGFVGHNCENTYVNPCSSSPCLNGAQCNAFNTFFSCACPAGFTGTLCQIDSVSDNQPPTIQGCPSSQSLFSPVGGAQATWVEPTATDNVDPNPSLIRQTHTPDTFFQLGRTTVTYVFTDDANNAATCSFYVTVFSINNDVTPPEITGCPTNNIVVMVSSSETGATATWNEPIATDNTGSNPTRTSTHLPGTRFPVGTTRVTYSFTDTSRNAATCSFNVVVNSGSDNTAPVIANCPQQVVVPVDPNSPYTLIEWTMPTATDESGPVTLSFSSVAEPRVLFQDGSQPVTITYVFTDPSGNSATCSFDVQSQTGTGDLIPPLIQNCPSDVQVEVPITSTSGVASWAIPTATDNSGVTPTRTQTHTPGSTFTVGRTPVTYSFTDGSGNVARCTFDVIVFMMADGDITPPTLTSCPNDIIADADGGIFFQLMTWTIPTATDDSGMALLESGTPYGTDITSAYFQVGQQYITNLVYTFTDPSGNEATCEFRIGALVNAPNPCLAGPCQNGGQCSQITNSYECACPAGFTGNRCQDQISSATPCASGPCLNGGQCTPVGNIYICTCVSGYSGDRCQTSPADACSPSPCLNGGQCSTFDNGNNYFCTCVNGFSGSRCQISSPTACASGPCLNGGQCTTVGNIYRCTCVSGYSGDRCEISPTNACSSSPCLNNGQCIPFDMGSNYFCLCTNGFTGPRCQSSSQPSVTCSPSIVPTSSDSDISYSPSLTNFGSTGNVQVTYTNTNQQANQIDDLVVTRPITTTPHSLDLPAGSNTVTVTASNGVSTATCTFQYFRTDLQCPPSSSGTSTALTFPVPSFTFPDNIQVDFIRYSTVAGQVITLSTALSDHTLTGFSSGTTTTISATATDSSGNTATCTFIYTYTMGGNVCSSNPCPDGENCFYFGQMYVCAATNAGRRRRDGDEYPDEYPCLNGATRVDDMGASICLCQPGFTGIFCQESDYAFDICQFNPCDHNGTCVDLSMQEGFVPGDYVCRCVTGWTGTHCQQFEGDTQLEPIPKGFILNTSEFIAIAFLVLLVVAAVGLCYLGMRLRYVRALVKHQKRVDEMPIVQ
ncbi:uncharacterized protein [Amphiura filiformis]|uniref:uncharacterized protein n=1 Tax=Amphiura filiformis TaxID=82378 RepID=UPI003B20D8FA